MTVSIQQNKNYLSSQLLNTFSALGISNLYLQGAKLPELGCWGIFQSVRKGSNMASPEEEQNLSKLNVQELMAEEKKRKSALTFHAFLIGLAVGIAVYSTVKHGFGFFAFFPLIFIISGNRASNKLKSVRAELKSRNL